MIIFDTNVISELAKPQPNSNVRRWFDRQDPDQFWTTAICEAEIYVGIALQPAGKRRLEIEFAMRGILGRLFPSRILPFDSIAAEHFAQTVALRRAAKLDTDQADGQIAAIAMARGARVATRNVKHFEHTGAKYLNPWMP